MHIKTPLPPSAFEVDTAGEDTAPRSRREEAANTVRIWVGDATRTLSGGTAWAAAAGASALVTICALLVPMTTTAPAKAAQVSDGIVHVGGHELSQSCGVNAPKGRAKLEIAVDTQGRVQRTSARGLGAAEAQCLERIAAGWDFLPQAQAMNLDLDVSVD